MERQLDYQNSRHARDGLPGQNSLLTLAATATPPRGRNPMNVGEISLRESNTISVKSVWRTVRGVPRAYRTRIDDARFVKETKP